MHRFIIYTTYAYYDSTTELEYDDRATIESNDDWEAAETYLKIDTKEEFIKALQYLIKESDAYEDISVKIEDLIRLLEDSSLGNTFFERCVINMDWLAKHPEAAKSVSSNNDFLINDKGTTILPIFKESREFQKAILQHNIDQDLEYDPKWFDVDEKDLQAWRSEADYNKLVAIRDKKQKQLKSYKAQIERLDRELVDLNAKISEFKR